MAAGPERGKLRARAPGLLLLAALALAPLRAAAQTLPPDDDWRQIETPRFRVTFPARLEFLARRAGGRAEHAWDQLAEVLPRAPGGGRIDLVLTDHADFSNGFATLAPRERIVVYARPPIDGFGLTYFDDWMELVITHELTHVFHLDYTSRAGEVLRALFGRVPTTWPFFPEQNVPRWVVEGAAVYYETAFGDAGRGAGTYHEMVTRTMALEGRFEPIDRTSGESAEWPGPERVYIYGSGFFEWLLARHGPAKMGDFIRAVGGQWIPYRLNAAARKAFGTAFSWEWEVWSGEVQARAEALRADLARRAPITRTEAVTTNARYVVGPAVSPDGRWLAFTRADGLTDPQLRVVGTNGEGSARRARLNDAGLFTWLADGGLVTAEFEFGDPYRLRSDLYQVGPDGRRTRLTRGARLDHPAALPGGRSVLAIQNRAGTTDVVIVSLDSGAVATLLPGTDDVHWANPVPSPDGRWIAAARWTLHHSFDLVLLARDDAGRWSVSEQITHDRAVEQTPTWSADSRWLLWQSDRSGIMNLYAASVDAAGRIGPMHQVTNVVTGIAYPSIDPAGRWIYGAVYHAQGWEVERLPFDPARWFEPLPLAPLYAPAVPAPLPSPAAGPSLPYRAARTVGPKHWEPYLWEGRDVLAPGRGTLHVLRPFFGATTYGADVVGRHAWNAAVGVSPTGGKLTGSVGYAYAGLGNPVLSLTAAQDWDAYGPVIARGSAGASDSLFVRRRDRTVQAAGTVVLRRFRLGATLGLAAAVVTQDSEVLDRRLDPTAAYGLDFPHVRLGDFRASATASTARAQALSISPEEGVAVSAFGRVRRHIHLADSLRARAGFDRAFAEGLARVRLYRPLRGLGLSRHVLALHVSGGAASGPGADRFHFAAGGASGSVESVTGLGLFGGSGYSFPIRGYGNGERSGTFAWTGSAEYRFPIARVNRGIGLVPIHLDQVSAAAFVDAGNAWGPTLRAQGARYDNPRQTALWSAGAELSADFLTLFSVPLPLRMGVALPAVDTGRGIGPVLYLRVGPSF